MTGIGRREDKICNCFLDEHLVAPEERLFERLLGNRGDDRAPVLQGDALEVRHLSSEALVAEKHRLDGLPLRHPPHKSL